MSVVCSALWDGVCWWFTADSSVWCVETVCRRASVSSVCSALWDGVCWWFTADSSVWCVETVCRRASVSSVQC